MSDSARGEGLELRRDRTAAQRRVNRIRAFRAELDALKSDGVISLTPEQYAAIGTHHDRMLSDLAAIHDVDASDATGQLSRGMQLASFFAALALTAAIYSLVARFWGQLALPMQATLLCAFPLMSLVGVEFAARRERTLYIASVFALVAYGTYGLAVVVLSDLLNMPVTPAAIWAGAFFGVSLALPYGFRLIFGAALVALLVAVAGSAFHAASMPWTLFAEHLDIITAAAFVLTLISPRLRYPYAPFAAMARMVGFGIGFLGLLILSTEGTMSLLPMRAPIAEVAYQVVMLLLCMVTLVVAVRREWIETVYVTAAALTLFIFVRFVDWFWDALPRFVFFLLLAAIAFAWLLVMRRVRGRLVARELA